jgi:hypothetical protein
MALGKRAQGILDVLFQPEEFDDRFEVRDIPKVKPRDVYGRPVIDELKPIDAPTLTLSDLEGYPYLSTMSDRTAASGLLTGIGDKELAYPIPLTGGQDFMFRNRELWASDSMPVDKMVAAGRELKKTYGRDPLFIPWRMTPTGSDFASEMTAGAMMSYASRNMPSAEKRRLNREIGALVPDFVGIDSPYAPTQMQLQPDPIRKRVQQQIMDKGFRESGGISLPQARLAIADQDQLNAPVLGFKNVGLFDVDAGNLRGRGNTTYPDAIAGEPLGRLETDATLLDLEPTNVYPAMSKDSAFGRSLLMDEEGQFRDPSTAEGFNQARRSAELNPFGGIIDETLLRSLESKGIKVSASPVSTIIGLGLAAPGLLGSEEAEAGPMTAALKRAKDQGFDTDTVYYHGSGNIQDIANNGFNPELTGKGNDQYGSGFYFTNNPSTASGYATSRLGADTPKLGGEDSPGVIQSFIRLENPLELDATAARNLNDGVIDLNPEQVRSMLNYSKALKRGVDAEDMNPLGDHYESFWDGGVEDWMLDDIAKKYAGTNIQTIESDLFDGDSMAFRDALSEATGYDGVKVTFPESGEVHVIPWKSDQIRSINAAFDPAKKDSSNLLAQVGGAGILGASALGGEEVEASPLVNVAKASKDISKGTQRSNTVGTAKKATAYLDEIGAKGRSLDYGAGLGLNAKATGIKDTFEPFPQKGFNPTFTDPNSVPKNKYGRIINTNVINVIEPETVINGEVRRLRDEVVTNIGQALKPNGVAVIQTWNPQAFKAGYKPETHELGSEPMSYITPDGQYQKAFTKDELKDYVSSVLGDGYEVTNVPNKVGLSGVGVAVKKIRQPATLKMAPIAGAGILAGAQSEDAEASFVGVMSKAGAGRSDLLVMAKRMEDEGVDPEDIWRFTGWEKNEADGEWRTELPNQPSSIKLPMTRKAREQKDNGLLGDFIKDEQLLSQYSGIQDLKNLRVYFRDEVKGGRYNPKWDAILLPLTPNKRDPGVLIHELQHAIQMREGFATGGSVRSIKDARGDSSLLDSFKADRNNLLAKIEKIGPENTSVLDMEELQNLNEAIDRAENFRKAEEPFKANPLLTTLDSQDFAMYQNIVGEVEANNVMYRMQYLGQPSVDDESVLRGMSPRSTEDILGIAPVERNLQIILDDDGLGITPVQSDYMDNYTAKIKKGMKEIAEEKKKSAGAAQSAAAVGLLGLPMTGSAAEAEAGKMLLGGVEDALRMVAGGITGLVGSTEKAEDILDSKLINPSPEFAEAQAAMLQPVFEDYVVPMVNAALDAKAPMGTSSRERLQKIAEMYNKLPDGIKEKLGYGAMTAFGILSLSPFGMGRAKDAPVDLELPKEQPKGLLTAM